MLKTLLMFLTVRILDGHDVHYGDDPLKGMRLGKGQLGGFSGAQGPGKGLSLGNSGAVVFQVVAALLQVREDRSIWSCWN